MEGSQSFKAAFLKVKRGQSTFFFFTVRLLFDVLIKGGGEKVNSRFRFGMENASG